MGKQRLELTWVGKTHRSSVEPRILLEDSEHSYHSSNKSDPNASFENRLIVGDNLLALKALEQEFAGRIRCAYIDPPFNSLQAFPLYDDSREHSLWLSLMRDRIASIHRLLSDDGTLFVHIDDNELGYLIVLMDELFGRRNRLFVATFRQGSATGHKAINPGCVNTTNFVLIYAKNKDTWRPNKVYTARDRDERYNQYIENYESPFEEWRFVPLMRAFAQSLGLTEPDARRLARENAKQITNFVVANARRVIRTARPSYDDVSAEARSAIDQSRATPDRIIRLDRGTLPPMFIRGGERILFYSDKVKVIDGHETTAEPLTTLWQDILSNNLHAEGGVSFPKGKKPEFLLKRVLELATDEGDLVLDSFAGSGTTGAVAHKMRRRWIMIEMGGHAHTHILPRMKAVIDGRDGSGVTAAVGWRGGGGFRFYRLAPSLIASDAWGNPVINTEYNPAMLAEALCKLEGFTYSPSETVYWQHGRSTERDFLYVTTANLGPDQLRLLSDDVGPDRTLLVLCTAFRGEPDAHPNLTVRKIPTHVLGRCEWGKDDYSLAIASLPPAPPPEGQQDMFVAENA